MTSVVTQELSFIGGTPIYLVKKPLGWPNTPPWEWWVMTFFCIYEVILRKYWFLKTLQKSEIFPLLQLLALFSQNGKIKRL